MLALLARDNYMMQPILGAVWIAATLRPANISVVDYYQGLYLDQLQRFEGLPNFWSPPSIFTPARWPSRGG
jgi:hypothetical protein